jgi:LysM repeat protein
MHVHLVTKGQTLAEIGNMYGVPVKELLAFNPFITNADVIYEGQLLFIPPSMKVKHLDGTVMPLIQAIQHMMMSLPMGSMGPMGMNMPYEMSQPYFQMNPHLQFNPYFQMNPHLQFNPYTQVNPQLQVNPTTQINPDVEVSPQTQVNPYFNFSPVVDVDLSFWSKRNPYYGYGQQ